jgi:CheY-like chemotaxis protein
MSGEVNEAGLDSARPTDAGAGGPRRVLYVDDDPMMITLITRLLGGEPTLALITATTGEQALHQACTHRPDIILLDRNLTDMSGERLLEALHADPRTRAIPTVVVSGDSAAATINQMTALGAAHYLTKPFRAADLRATIARVLDRAR